MNESMTLADLQKHISNLYGDKDRTRGPEGTYLWLAEEVGELAAALRVKDQDNLAMEFADVLAWLATLANVTGVDLTDAIRRKYGDGCPGCRRSPCACSLSEKP
jgi:NTP pyrophosphatase (non-canonical NTP hydrolase)